MDSRFRGNDTECGCHPRESGFHAFAKMGGAREFLATVNRRESVINARLFAREPDPFRSVD